LAEQLIAHLQAIRSTRFARRVGCLIAIMRPSYFLLASIHLAVRTVTPTNSAALSTSNNSSGDICNATLRSNTNIGVQTLAIIWAPDVAACCAACIANRTCVGFVLDHDSCFLKGDVSEARPKSGNTAGYIRAPVPPGPWPPRPPAPPAKGAPEFELMRALDHPVISASKGEQHGIKSGFEGGMYTRTEDGLCVTAAISLLAAVFRGGGRLGGLRDAVRMRHCICMHAVYPHVRVRIIHSPSMSYPLAVSGLPLLPKTHVYSNHRLHLRYTPCNTCYLPVTTCSPRSA